MGKEPLCSCWRCQEAARVEAQRSSAAAEALRKAATILRTDIERDGYSRQELINWLEVLAEQHESYDETPPPQTPPTDGPVSERPRISYREFPSGV